MVADRPLSIHPLPDLCVELYRRYIVGRNVVLNDPPASFPSSVTRVAVVAESLMLAVTASASVVATSISTSSSKVGASMTVAVAP